MAKEVIGASVNIEYKSVGEMRKAIKEATGEVVKLQSQFGNTSKEALAAAKRVADLKDRLQEAGETVDLFDPGNKFKVFGNAVTAAAGGFAALQGALGLFGVKSKEVEEQLLKVQSALALSQGLSTIADAGKDFSRLASIVKDRVVSAFTTLRGAIISTGIGALVVALGALIANFDKLKNVIDGVSGAQKDIAENSKAAAETEQKKLETLDSQDNVLKLQGKSEKEIIALKIQQIEQVIKLREQQLIAAKELQQQQIAGAQRNKDILLGFLNFLTAPLKFALSTANQIAQLVGRGLSDKQFESAFSGAKDRFANLFFDPKEVAAETDAGLQEIEVELNKLQNQRAGLILQQRGTSKLKGGVVERIFPDLVALTDPEQVDEIIKNVFDNVGRLTNTLSEIAINPELEKLRRSILLTPEQQDLLNLQDYYNQQMELVKGNQGLELALTEQFEKQKTEITRFYNQQRLQIVAGILGQAANILGKQTAAGKALAIAEATINTYTGATEALRAKVPFPEPAATAIRIAQAAVIIGSGIKSIKEIVKTKVPNGGGGGAVPQISTAAPLTPQISPQAQAQALNAEAINNLGNTALRAYILNADIQNQQQINEYLKRGSTI